MKLVYAIMISIPFVIVFVIFGMGWFFTGMSKDSALLAIMAILLPVVVVGRVWYKYFDGKKYGNQSKLDDFQK